MKARILNSGIGKRMGEITKTKPKCMTPISETDTIVSRQLKMLEKKGITEVVMTTGPFEDILKEYCESLGLNLNITFVHNEIYDKTNYIYSIYKAKENLDDDIVLMHGDLVYGEDVLDDVLANPESCMTVSTTLPLPEKDFKAVIKNGKISKVGIEFFDDALAAQPLYKLNREDWSVWLDSIVAFVEHGTTNCYAENAFNVVSDYTSIKPLDVQNRLCGEIDNLDDLEIMKGKLAKEVKTYEKRR